MTVLNKGSFNIKIADSVPYYKFKDNLITQMTESLGIELTIRSTL